MVCAEYSNPHKSNNSEPDNEELDTDPAWFVEQRKDDDDFFPPLAPASTPSHRTRVWADARNAIQQYLYVQRTPKKLIAEAKASILLSVCKEDGETNNSQQHLQPRARVLAARYLSSSAASSRSIAPTYQSFETNQDASWYEDWTTAGVSSSDTSSAVSWPVLSSRNSDTSSTAGEQCTESTTHDCNLHTRSHHGSHKSCKVSRALKPCKPSSSRYSLSTSSKSALTTYSMASVSDSLSSSPRQYRQLASDNSLSQKVVLHWHFTSRNGSQSFSSLLQTPNPQEGSHHDFSRRSSSSSETTPAHSTTRVSWPVQASKLPSILIHAVMQTFGRSV